MPSIKPTASKKLKAMARVSGLGSSGQLPPHVQYLLEFGMDLNQIKEVTRSVDNKLRPTAEFFKSMGVDVADLLSKCPQTFNLSLEGNLKRVTEFFMKNGYDRKDISTMASRFGSLYTLSLSNNLIPKCEYFLTSGYTKSALIKFPPYFGYSLEERIKPRFAKVKSSAAKFFLNRVLSLSDVEFEKMLQNC